jgi:hypothetical protein
LRAFFVRALSGSPNCDGFIASRCFAVSFDITYSNPTTPSRSRQLTIDPATGSQRT